MILEIFELNLRRLTGGYYFHESFETMIRGGPSCQHLNDWILLRLTILTLRPARLSRTPCLRHACWFWSRGSRSGQWCTVDWRSLRAKLSKAFAEWRKGGFRGSPLLLTLVVRRCRGCVVVVRRIGRSSCKWIVLRARKRRRLCSCIDDGVVLHSVECDLEDMGFNDHGTNAELRHCLFRRIRSLKCSFFLGRLLPVALEDAVLNPSLP